MDIDGTSTLESTKTEYCQMEPQSPHMISFPTSPISRPSAAFSGNKKQTAVQRSVSIGPVNDIYSYRKQRDNFFSIENYVNNRILPEDLVEEPMYGSWCSSSHKALLGSKCDGSCSNRTGSLSSGKSNLNSIQDHNCIQNCFFKIRSYVAVAMFMIALVTGMYFVSY